MNDFKFGDRLKTRDGRMAIYILKHVNFHYLIVDFDDAIKPVRISYKDNGVCLHPTIRDYDIIGRWEENKPAIAN